MNFTPSSWTTIEVAHKRRPHQIIYGARFGGAMAAGRIQLENPVSLREACARKAARDIRLLDDSAAASLMYAVAANPKL